jgi:anti-sigma factor RsiW
MSCSKCRRNLSAWLDGELPRELAQEVERHLSQCESCAARRAELEALEGALDGMAPAEPSAGFDAAFARRLQEARRAQRRSRGEEKERWRGWLWPALAAVSAACVAVVVVVVLRAGQPAPPTRPAGEVVLARNLELLRNYDVVANLEALEDADVVMDLDALMGPDLRDEGRTR